MIAKIKVTLAADKNITLENFFPSMFSLMVFNVKR